LDHGLEISWVDQELKLVVPEWFVGFNLSSNYYCAVSKIYVAGINGLVGSNVSRKAKARGYEVSGKSSSRLDFTDRSKTFIELEVEKPDVLVIAAAIVGGIGANLEHPVKFLTKNLQIQCNLIDGAFNAGISKLVFLGSSCIYPKLSPQPIVEDYLLSGKLESSNQPYAIAKIAGIELVNSYRKQFGVNWVSVMPSNLYGPNDNFDLNSSHVLAALIRKIHAAKVSNMTTVTIWGDGSPLREFLHVEDAADAILHLAESKSQESIFNLGSDYEISILELAKLIAEVVGFTGNFVFDNSRPNGTPRKLMSSDRLASLGWKPKISLKIGIRQTYEWCLTQKWISEWESIK
jgi:GDP-L-fucose synthase